mmetsp:Transcript_59564/g.171984  ORF Transcript_59564/g.171984 Transcript_59564/m.171984 type:complete len:571 (+) Transcript_59564:76-1788(+)
MSIFASLLHAVSRLGSALLAPGGGDDLRQWSEVAAPGRRVLVLVASDSSKPDAEANAFEARAAGCIVRIATLAKRPSAADCDVVVLDYCLSALPEAEARAAVVGVCGELGAGAALVVQDAAVLPASAVLGLLRLVALAVLRIFVAWRPSDDEKRGLAVHDVAAWLPADMRVEARRPIGWLQETTTLRRLARSPVPEADELRRRYGCTSMAMCTSASANRVDHPEAAIRYFLHRGDAEEATGYVAYTEHIVLGARLRLTVMDPVCPSGSLEAVLTAFLADCSAAQARPIFACVSSACTPLLRRLGYHTTKLGGELGIDLAAFRLPRERCRYMRVAPAKGLECFPDCWDLDELRDLNAEWVKGKGMGSEIGIWTYPPSMPAEDRAASAAEVRRLFTYQDGRLVGFICAEPFYNGDGSLRLLGYGLSTIRFVTGDAPSWASDFTIATLIQNLQAEGSARYLAFGLSPWTDLRACDGELVWLRLLFQAIWAANVESFYGIRGLAKKKEHHCARQGEPLEERFISGVPFYAFPDFVRFTILLFGENLPRVPMGLVILARTQVSALVQRLRARLWS